MPPVPANRQTSLVGRKLGRYEVLLRIATGGMAAVYLARTRSVGGFERVVALKVLHPHLAHEEEFVAMFLDEARLAARIRHPNVVPTLDIHDSGGDGYFLVMEYIEGDALSNLLARSSRSGARLPLPVVLRIAVDMLSALSAAHTLKDDAGRPLKVVHRDVSPQNVLVGVDGVARLTDFGVAKAEVRIAATREGAVKGKLAYMAPEQAEHGIADQRSDLFSAGVVLWEAIAGERLFRAENNAALLQMILRAQVAPVSSVRPEAAPLDAILLKALSIDPAQRYQSAEEFSLALEHEAATLGGIAQPRQVAELVRRWAGERLAEQTSALHKAEEALDAGQIPQETTGPELEVSDGISSRSGARASRPLPPPPSPPEVQEQTVAELRTGNLKAEARAAAAKEVAKEVPNTPAVTPSNRTPLVLFLGAVAVLGVVGGLALLRSKPTQVTPRVTVADAGSAGANDTEALEHAREASSLTGAGDEAPRVLQGDPPESPDPTLALMPTVVCRVLIDTQGRVRNAEVFRPRAELASFEQRALEAVSRYRFAPARSQGRVVPVWLNLPLSFSRAREVAVLHVAGSETLGAELLPALARAYGTVQPLAQVEVETLGSSSAFGALFSRRAEVGLASRAVTQAELRSAAQVDVTLEELVLGYDAIALIVHRDNSVRSLHMDQVAQLFSGAVRDWNAVGGTAGEVHPVGRPQYSGTRMFLRDRVLRRTNPTADFSPDLIVAERAPQVVSMVAGDPGAIGFVSRTFVTDAVRVLAVAPRAGETALEPTVENASSNAYPLTRPLHAYTRGHPRGEVAGFLRFVFSPPGRAIFQRLGFVSATMPPGALRADAPDSDRAFAQESLLFSFDERVTDVSREQRRSILRAAASAAERNLRAVVLGHGDGGGEVRDADALGRQRAESVAALLRRGGMTEVLADTAGAWRPLALNDRAEGRARNRRVEVYFLANVTAQ